MLGIVVILTLFFYHEEEKMNTIKNKGFTIIELMIAVAIIGILAAIAVPAYSDYTTRARVTEGLSFADAAKTVVAENAQSGASDLSAGWVTPSATSNISRIVVNGTTGAITVTTTSAAGDGTFTLTPSAGGATLAAGTATNNAITWTCAAGTLATKFLPSQCR